MNELKKNDLIKAQKLCNIFRFIDDLNSIMMVVNLKVVILIPILRNYSQIKKILINMRPVFWIQTLKDGKFQFNFFDKRSLLPFSIVRMPGKSSNVPSSTVYSAIGAESLRITRASNNPESFSTTIKPLIARMSRQGVSIEKINSAILKNFNKRKGDFNNVCQSKQELPQLVT